MVAGTFHIKCFERLLDLSSLEYALCFEPDRKHVPDLVEMSILGEYTRRWLAWLNYMVCHVIMNTSLATKEGRRAHVVRPAHDVQ